MSCTNILDNDSTLLTPPTYGQSFTCHTKVSNHNAAAASRIQFRPDGTWACKNGTAGNLPNGNGNWYVGIPASPGDYEIRLTGTVVEMTINSGESCAPSGSSSSPEDSGWVSLNTMFESVVSAYAYASSFCSDAETDTTLDFVIQIRRIANHADSVTASGSICAEASAIAIS